MSCTRRRATRRSSAFTTIGRARGAQAVGITLSRRRHEEAQRWIAAAGLDAHARVDSIAPIGMVELGRERLREYFGVAYRVLRPGGLFLNHGITTQTRDGRGFRAARDFMGRYVFPDGDLVALDTMLRCAEAVGFKVRDVENLREHYARTARAWVANLTANRTAAVRDLYRT